MDRGQVVTGEPEVNDERYVYQNERRTVSVVPSVLKSEQKKNAGNRQ